MDFIAWHDENLVHFQHAIEQICAYLNHAAPAGASNLSPPEAIDCPPNSAIAQLQQRFSLTVSERDILLLCAAMEVVPHFSQLCANIPGFQNTPYPSFKLASQVLPSFQWATLTCDSALESWYFLEIEPHEGRGTARLTIDPMILTYLLGDSSRDRQLRAHIYPVNNEPKALMPLTYKRVAQALAAQLVSVTSPLPLLQLCGSDFMTQRQIAVQAAQAAGILLERLDSRSLPIDPNQLFVLIRRWERFAALTGTVLLVEVELESMGGTSNLEQQRALIKFLRECHAIIIVSSPERLTIERSPTQAIEVPKLSAHDRQQLWLEYLGDRATALNSTIAQIAEQFSLSPHQINTLVYQLPDVASPDELRQCLWQACRQSARPQLQDLAQRVETKLSWDDLILPESLTQRLKSIVAAVRQRHQVYQDWGFAHKQDRGLGIMALFAGESGTGKTTAAEIIAKELELDCYRVDLSNIVNKYIGETEKNLKRVFDAAEGSGAMLLFDEADAIFGMRGEVKEAKDRYANQEVSYLLQRLETFPGIAILTTNLKKSIDEAFLRRLRYVIDFPTPTEGDRLLMWQRVFPQDAPLANVNHKRLAKLNVTGSNIRNIALTAAFLAADTDKAITMEIVGKAVDVEYDKLGRQLSGPEFSALRGEIAYPRL